ncbi:DUF3298 and DUF4163 domain-containing protein [Aquimarina rhabdastrellae]
MRNLFLSVFLFISLFGCTKKESLIFDSLTIDPPVFKNCESLGCAEIAISIPKSVIDGDISIKINKTIEQHVCKILDIEESSTTSITSAISSFNTSFQQLKQEFPDTMFTYEASIDGEVLYQDDNIISITISSYLFTGGAHGNQNVTMLNFNPSTGKLLTHTDIFTDIPAFKSYVESIFRTQYKIPPSESINSTGFFFDNDQFVLPENIGFLKDHIIFIYNQYEIASYADGVIEFSIPKSDLNKHLKL